MVKMQKPEGDGGACPRCGGRLLYNGKGLSCIACSYFRHNPPSEKSMMVPKQKRKEK
jgi:hypothetical protein